MSTTRSIIFFSKTLTPTVQKMIDFTKKECIYKPTKFDSDLVYGEEDVWIHSKGVNFEYFGIEEDYSQRKDLKTFFHIGASNTVYKENNKRYFYNYPFFHKLMKHIENDYQGDLYIICLNNGEKVKPRWLSEWKGKFLENRSQLTR